MALPNVRILLANGQLGGIIPFADGVTGMVGTGVSVTSLIQIGTPELFFSLADAEARGVTLADNPIAYKQVKDFYAEAPVGTEMYLMLVPDTLTQTEIMDVTEATGAVKLLDYAQGRVRMLGSFFTISPYSPTTTAAIDADVLTAIPKAHALGAAYALVQAPLRCVVEGKSYTGVPASLTDLKTMAYNRVSVVVANDVTGTASSVGAFLGRMAKNPVQRKPSRVRSGPVPFTTAFVGAQDAATHSGLGLMHDKGYIVLRTFPGKTGFFWSSDPTCCPATDDYSSFARGRVIDKAHIIAYLTVLDELDEEIAVNDDGTMEIGFVKTLEQKVERQIGGAMAGQISAVTMYINPAQDILGTNLLSATLKVRPVGYASDIEIELGFENPNA